MRRVGPLLAALLIAGPAFAEQSKFNLHLEPGAGTGLNKTTFVSGGWFKLDTTLFGLGPVAPQIEFFGLGTQNRTYLAEGAAFGGGIGLRLRLLNDEKGFFFNPGTTNTGNLWGNLWIDAHLTFSHANLGLGFDAALGYEFSLIDGLQVGPYARFSWIGSNQLMTFGLTFSVGFPSEIPADSDPDGDGIKGAADKCPNEPEDKDGFEDEDGCPDLDNDKDGIPDVADKCPNEPEDKDGFEDEDGCPDPDNDKDGIPDLKDKCPNEPETFNGVEDEDGCPEKETKVFITREKVQVTEKIFFEFNKANILPKSDGLLDNVAGVLNKFPQVKKIRIEGHTDDVGTDAQNQTLSEKRAKSVLDALVKRKVDAGRLEVKGYGKSMPLVKENTDAAREQNRRVEFIVVEMTPIVEEVPAKEVK